MSIFQPLLYSQGHSEEFWLETPFLPNYLETEKELFKGGLYIADLTNVLQKVSMHLTSSNLFFYTEEDTVKSADIRWLLLSPFTEDSEHKGKQFGFSLKSLVKTYDFYVESEAGLNQWVNLLSEIVIMSDFDIYFMIIKNIDSGHFGEVKLCTNLYTNEHFAVKIVEKSKLAKRKILKCLYNEILIQKKLDHQNIVKLYKVFEDENFVYLVMEYVKEGNLLERIQMGSIEAAEAINFSKNLLEVVQYIHGQGVIHRDLKPENILIEEKHSISMFKIADFGLAYFSTENKTKCSGSPGYIAPEILRGQPYNSKSDIFSVGVISYQLISRFSPFQGSDLQDLVRQNSKCNVNFGFAIFKSVPLFTQNFLKKVLNPNPDSRPSALEILQNEWRWNAKGSDSTSGSSSAFNTFTFVSNKFTK